MDARVPSFPIAGPAVHPDGKASCPADTLAHEMKTRKNAAAYFRIWPPSALWIKAPGIRGNGVPCAGLTYAADALQNHDRALPGAFACQSRENSRNSDEPDRHFLSRDAFCRSHGTMCDPFRQQEL